MKKLLCTVVALALVTIVCQCLFQFPSSSAQPVTENNTWTPESSTVNFHVLFVSSGSSVTLPSLTQPTLILPLPQPEEPDLPLPVPQNVRAMVSGNDVTVFWEPVAGALGHLLYIDDRAAFPTSRPDQQKYRALGDGKHTASVSALLEDGEGPKSEPIEFMIGDSTQPPPPPPETFPITITWEPVTHDEGGELEEISHYNVLVNGVWRHGVSLGTEATIDVRTGDSVTVNAVDAAGNISRESVPYVENSSS